MFDAEDAKFRSIKLRPKQADCAVCGEKPSVTQLVDYEAFCGAAATDKVGEREYSDGATHLIGSRMRAFPGMLFSELIRNVSCFNLTLLFNKTHNYSLIT